MRERERESHFNMLLSRKTAAVQNENESLLLPFLPLSLIPAAFMLSLAAVMMITSLVYFSMITLLSDKRPFALTLDRRGMDLKGPLVTPPI